MAELFANELERDTDLPPHHARSDHEFQTLRLIASGNPYPKSQHPSD